MVCAKVCFYIVYGLDQTLCLQPMAGHSVWHHKVTQEPYKKQNLGTVFKIAEEYWKSIELILIPVILWVR